MRRMRTLLAISAFAVASTLVGSLAVGDTAVPDCIAVRKEARYGAYAYNHFVVLTNRCEQAARCTVSTSANPEEKAVRVGVGETKEVVTYIGSPARDFDPNVRCTLEGRR